MTTGFFSKSTLHGKPVEGKLPQCGLCGLYRGCKSPKMEPSGEGRKGILIVAECPGKTEDQQGTQLVGKSGQKLRAVLDRIDIDLERDCWKTNSVICAPPNNQYLDKNKKCIAYCRPTVLNTITKLKPAVIILLGSVAVQSLLTSAWGKSPGTITRWAGMAIPWQEGNAWICPTWHPAYLLRANDAALERFWRAHLGQAAEMASVGRPWPKGPPDYARRVERIRDVGQAASIIREMIAAGGRSAFDLETNMLKPDSTKARIVCASVCHEGRRTIAFSWHGEAITAMREFIRSDLRKIGANIKFEHRWLMKEFGREVRNWVWDVTIGAHILDNRRDITSLKFQAFSELGVALYNQHIEEMLQPRVKGGNQENRISEIDLDSLLGYCGEDSLYEFLIAKRQMKKMGINKMGICV